LGLAFMHDFLVIAHRGMPARAPENSIEGLEMALVAGADMVEIDVRATRDDNAVVIHDENLERTTSGRGPVCEYALDELVKMRLKNSEPIPTLEDILRRLNDRCQLNIDVKSKGAGPLALELVEEMGMLKDVLFSSFEGPVLLRMKATNPRARVALICDDRRLSVLKIADSLGAEAVHPHSKLVNRTLVQDAHALGIRVHVWTVNRKGMLKRLLKTGVDGVITDRTEFVCRLLPRLR
jgi:glycerophosphoryl diester phosphodiesterase